MLLSPPRQNRRSRTSAILVRRATSKRRRSCLIARRTRYSTNHLPLSMCHRTVYLNSKSRIGRRSTPAYKRPTIPSPRAWTKALRSDGEGVALVGGRARIDSHTHCFAVGGVTLALSRRAIARECLHRRGAVSACRDSLALRRLPPPRSLREDRTCSRRTRCRPQRLSGLQVTDVADRHIRISWIDQSDNEHGFSSRFRGESAGCSDHTGSHWACIRSRTTIIGRDAQWST